MKSAIIRTAGLSLFLATACSHPAEKAIAETSVKVWGNCEHCEETIEKAGKINGVESADWDQKSKLLHLKMDSSITNKDAVLKSIAGAGYDNELYKGSDEAYANLPECCQYQRKND